MIHQPSGGSRGMASDIQIQAREIQDLKGLLNGILSERTGKSLDIVTRDTDRDYYMSPTEALEYGIIDRIYTRRGEKPRHIKLFSKRKAYDFHGKKRSALLHLRAP